MSERDTRINEEVVLIARSTGWSLEYILGISNSTRRIFYEELLYQLKLDHYREANNAAMIAVTLANSFSTKRTYKRDDFIGEPPQRRRRNEKEPGGP